MIVPDTDLLIYAVNTESPQHARAEAWLDALLRGDEPVGLSWTTLHGFLRLTTNARIMTRALHITDAMAVVDLWLSNRLVTMVQPGDGHWSIMRDLLREAGRGANLTTDAHLAALCIERGATLHTADGDFSRFRGLRWKNPLVMS